MAKTAKRRMFLGKQTLVPGVRFTGHDVVRAADQRGLNAHDHGAAYELCLIVSGGVDWWVGSEIYEVGPGEIYLTRPHERHGAVDSMLQPCELYWCGFELDDRAAIASLNRAETRLIAQRFASLQHRHFRSSPEVADAFARLIAAQRDGGPLAGLEARVACLNLLLGSLRCHDSYATLQRRISATISQAMRWISDHLEDDVAIDDLAKHFSLSATRFHERFRREVGYSPGDWRARQRIKRAKQLLRQTDQSITHIALRCGFSSSQYFATTFKRLVGLTPRQYRRRSADSHDASA
ncbi:MAG: helix-turn-helix transcriptional regulator [Phycisphaeraceae bacterium]|nr:helix-turn-helix transcriptional regulator [Phycisphaeraceae bacterium]